MIEENSTTPKEVEKVKAKQEKPALQFLSKNVPVYLAILLLLLGLTAGWTIRAVMTPVVFKTVTVDGDSVSIDTPDNGPVSTTPSTPKVNPPIKGVVVYSENCKSCTDTVSFLRVFERNGIEYDVERISAESEEGKKLVQDYKLLYAPTLLLDPETIPESTFVELKDGRQAGLMLLLEDTKVKDKFVLPEMNLDESNKPQYLFIQPQQTCQVKEGEKVPVLFFNDPYCPECVTKMRKFHDQMFKFQDQFDFDFSYAFTTTSELMQDYNYADLTSKYLMCAEMQDKEYEFEEQVKAIYCDKSGERNLTDAELSGCMLFNDRWMEPLIKEELDAAAKRAQMERTPLDNCLEQIEEGHLLEGQLKKAEIYGVENVPLFVIGCRYIANPLNLQDVACELRPEAANCKNTKLGKETEVFEGMEAEEAEKTTKTPSADTSETPTQTTN